ncbi:MAG: DUF4249 domain-containing protein [Bacteroidales bacterium]|nr:DUF4249 domain-containing protein [Bacteroidales bacterium]
MKKLIYIIIVLAIAFTACEKTLDFPFEYKKPKLVLNCVLSSNKEIEFHVSRSMHILDSKEIVMISDADVIIFEDDKPLQVVPISIDNGYYKVEYTPKAGHTYKFQISKDGFETIEAEAKMANPTKINSYMVKIKGSENDNMILYGGTFDVSLNFNDDSEQENYYVVYLTSDLPAEIMDYIETYDMYNDYYRLFLDCNDLSVNTGNSGDMLYLSDEIINGGNYTIKLVAYDYRDIYGPFYEYPFPDENEDPEEGEGSGIEELPFYNGFDYKLVVHVATINKDYYQYLKSFDMYNENDGNPFAEPTLVKTNIKNGLGILGASSEVTDTVTIRVNNPYIEEN